MSASSRRFRRSRFVAVVAGVASVGLVSGCFPSGDEEPTASGWHSTMPEENDTEHRVRQAALAGGSAGLRALDLDQTQVEGATRVIVCTDSLGLPSEERIGNYSTRLEPGALTDDQVSGFTQRLGGEALGDSVPDLTGTRRVSVWLPIDGIDVAVRLVREDDGSASLSAVTLCEK